MVVVLIALGGPPDGILGGLVHDNILVLGRTAGEDAGHDVDRIKLSQLPFFVAGERGIHFFLKQELIGGIADDLGCAENAVFGKIEHGITPFKVIRFSRGSILNEITGKSNL